MVKDKEKDLKSTSKKIEEIDKKLTYTTALAWFNVILTAIVLLLIVNS